jgi:hypothetical protein
LRDVTVGIQLEPEHGEKKSRCEGVSLLTTGVSFLINKLSNKIFYHMIKKFMKKERRGASSR